MNIIPSLDYKDLLAALPVRVSTAHKGDFGHILIIGGDYGYAGAPVLAALGALRVGAGLVTIASHKDHLSGLNACHPEIMCHAIDKPTLISELLHKATVVVLGPGLGRSSWSQKVYNQAIKTDLPMVLDGDGLYFLAKKPNRNINRVLTPHAREAGYLLHQQQAIPEELREFAVEQLINKFSSTVALKGYGTLIGSPDTHITKCVYGNPGMASGGMGDLLSGMIAGLISQGLDLDIATKLAVCVHAKAGDMASNTGQRGLIATDLLLPIKLLME